MRVPLPPAYGRPSMRTPAVTETANTLSLELPNDPRAAGRARRAVDALDGRAHPEILAKARLLVTELVTAAVGQERPGSIRVRLSANGGAIRGEISTDLPPAALLSGWGLLLVKRMADAWGSDRGILWFDVAGGPRRLR